MKTICSMVLMFVAALGITACSSSDDDGNNDGSENNVSVSDFLEVSIDGKKYTQSFAMPFVAVTLPGDVEKGLWLSSSVEEAFNGDVNFAIAIYHKCNIDALLKSSLGSYNVIGNKKSVWQQANDIHNLTLQLGYRNGNGNCDVMDGTHRVTSIKKKNDDAVMISGSFTASLKDNKSFYEVSGKYQVTVSGE